MHKSVRRLSLVLVSCAISCFLSPSSNAQLLGIGISASAKLDAEFGLDPATREFIDKLPAEIRAQVIVLLEQALPLVDKSVNGYLDHVNSIITEQTDHAACVITATVATIEDQLKDRILSRRDTPVETLVTWRIDLQNEHKQSTAPLEYAVHYEDFLAAVAQSQCNLHAGPALARLDGLANEARGRWKVWRQLENKCGNADECYTYAHAQTQAAINTADPRDIAAVGASTKFNSVGRPEKIAWYSLSKFHQGPYEDQIGTLQDVQQSLLVARLARESKAARDRDAAQKLIEAGEASIAQAAAGLSDSNINANANAKAVASSSVAHIKDINDALEEAKTLNALLSPDVATLKTRADALEPHSAAVIAQADAKSRAIIIAQQQQMMRILNHMPRFGVH